MSAERELRDEVARLEAALAAERRHSEQWRAVAEQRRVAMERLRQHPAARVAFRVAAVALPPLRRSRRRLDRARRELRRVASSVEGAPARLTAARREGRLRAALAALPPAPAPEPGRRVSVLVVTRDGADRLARLLPALRATTGPERAEILVVDNAATPATQRFLAAQPDVRVLRSPTHLTFAAATNLAARAATGDLLCLLNDDVEPIAHGWLARMLAALSGDVAVVGAQLVYPRRPWRSGRTRDLGVQHAGIGFEPGGRTGGGGGGGGVPRAVNLGAGRDPAVGEGSGAAVREVAAVTAACMLVARGEFLATGGFDEGYDYGAEDVDFCWRLRRAGRRAAVARDAVLFHAEGATRMTGEPAERVRRQAANWDRFAALHGPAVSRAVTLDRLRGEGVLSASAYLAAITVTRDLERAGYGDWYTAHELGTALRALGWEVRYAERYRDAWYDQVAGADLVVALLDTFDLRRVARPGLATVAWVRNWTHRWLSAPWFGDYDAVLASSEASALLVAEGSRHRPVRFPLATDPGRFTPGNGPRDGVVFAGNAWGAGRDMAALARALPGLVVHGRGWEDVPELAGRAAGPVPYSELPDVYRRAAVVVDQTAAPTRPYGAVNGRVFDALAAGALVVSDNAEGSRELFGGRLPVWESPEQLRELVDGFTGDPPRARALAAQLRTEVLRHHTYAHRAASLRDLLVERAERTRYVLLTGAPDRRSAPTWGDWHVAEALARELRALGHPVQVETADRWRSAEAAAADVAVHLKGRGRAPRNPGQTHVLWVISHPYEVTPEECDAADLVCVASTGFAAELAMRTATPVHVLLQATDHRRFRPRPPEARYRHPVAFVGNSRFVLRPAVADALAAGLRPVIYGANWDRYVDPEQVAARFVPNEELPAVYSSVGVLLNDHWEDMRRHGFVSNRIFDALACEAAVVSDDAGGLRDLFGDAVVTYKGPDDLRERVETLLADAERRRRMGEEGRAAVLAAHTFAHRAATLRDLVEERRRARA